MNINLNQLRAFYAVAKHGTFSRAAKELFVTEPAVFVQVRTLERVLGFKLLDKFGKELRTTEVGSLLYGYAEKIFGLVEEAEKSIREVGALEKGELRVGATNALAQYLLPIVLPAFNAKHPKIQLCVEEAGSTQLVNGIVGRDYELAIVARVAYPDTIEAIPLSRDEIVLIASPKNDLTTRTRCSIKELQRHPMICRDMRSATRLAVWREFEKRNIKPSAIIEAGNTELIKQLVASGRGVCLLPHVCVTREVERKELAIVAVDEGPFFLDIDAVHLKDRTLSPAARMFLHFLKQTTGAEDLNRCVHAMGKKGE